MSSSSLVNPSAFFLNVRRGILGPTLSEGEVSGCNAILTAFEGFPLADAAYALGTAFLETGGTMQPIKENGGPKYFHRMYDIRGARPKKALELGNTTPGDGVKYCGRGYPQVTGRKNYARAEKIFGAPLVQNPDLMLEPDLAGKVMAHFMKLGLFTGRRLSDYLPRQGRASRAEFTLARPIINGRDREDDVADFALEFQDALVVGGWQ